MLEKTKVHRSRVVFSLLALMLTLSGCGSNSDTSDSASLTFKQYVLDESKLIAAAWDSSIQPLLGTTDLSLTESTKELMTALASFSITAKKASDGIPSNVGGFQDEARRFETALNDMTIESTNAWLAIMASEPSDLQKSLDTISNSFVKLTILVKRFSEK
jgi:hypothetical protein